MIRNWLEPLPLIAILRGLEPDEAVAIGTVLADAGFRILEVPMNSPRPLDSIQQLSQALAGRCLIGAGTVLDTLTVSQVAEAGGRLAIMPHTDVDTITAAVDADLYCIPGVATPSEAFAALRAGACALKAFPGEMITPSIIKAWRAVLPGETLLLPVGGITPDCMHAYVQAGASGFGLGSALFKPEHTLKQIEQAAREFAQAWNSLHSKLGVHA